MKHIHATSSIVFLLFLVSFLFTVPAYAGGEARSYDLTPKEAIARVAIRGHWVSGWGTTPKEGQIAAIENAQMEIKNGTARCIGFAEGGDPMRYDGKDRGLYKFSVYVSHHRGSCKQPSRWQETMQKKLGIRIWG